MPRPRTHTKESLATSAMEVFWHKGYETTSLDDLVRATGVSRHGIYKDFADKHALFVASFPVYQQNVVTPAFEQVERDQAGFDEVASYFEMQISKAEMMGLPGPGCLVANTTTETVANETAVANCIEEHMQRLQSGFANVLRSEAYSPDNVEEVSRVMVVFTQGLWSTSRISKDANQLRQSVNTFLKLIQHRGSV